MTDHIIAVDIDLHRIHAWSSQVGCLLYKADLSDAIHAISAQLPPVLLIEVASAVDYTSKASGAAAIAHNKRRWALYNLYAATKINAYVPWPHVVVAPSSAWTEGYPEKVRHAMFNITGNNHDLRECRCMIEMYRRNPGRWMPLDEYMEKL